MGLLYDAATTIAVLAGSPYLLWRSLRRPEEMRERWGRGLDWRLHEPTWWHAASVGELEALRPVLSEVRRRRLPGAHALTVLTPSGRARAEGLWEKSLTVRMAPLDWRPIVSRHLRRLDPRALVLVETEIWPGLLWEVHRRGIPVGLVNGRISPHSFKWYKRLRGLFHPLLERIRCVGARTEEDARAFLELGVPQEALRVTGNTKYTLPPNQGAGPPWLRRDEWSSIVVLGSLRSGELEPVRDAVRVFVEGVGKGESALIVLAPRHLDRASSFLEIPKHLGLPHARRTEIQTVLDAPPSGPSVLILDTLGELSDLWWASTAGFVGGTLASLGGHNLYEPACRACPTLFGPSVETVSDVAGALLEAGGGRIVADGKQLGEALLELVTQKNLSEEMARRAREAAAHLSGGAERSVDWLSSRGVLTTDG